MGNSGTFSRGPVYIFLPCGRSNRPTTTKELSKWPEDWRSSTGCNVEPDFVIHLERRTVKLVILWHFGGFPHYLWPLKLSQHDHRVFKVTQWRQPPWYVSCRPIQVLTVDYWTHELVIVGHIRSVVQWASTFCTAVGVFTQNGRHGADLYSSIDH